MREYVLGFPNGSEYHQDTVNTLRERIKNIAGGKVTVAMQEQGAPYLNIEISGDNFIVLGEIEKRVSGSDPHVEDVWDNFVEGLPSTPCDRAQTLFGLSTNAIVLP